MPRHCRIHQTPSMRSIFFKNSRLSSDFLDRIHFQKEQLKQERDRLIRQFPMIKNAMEKVKIARDKLSREINHGIIRIASEKSRTSTIEYKKYEQLARVQVMRAEDALQQMMDLTDASTGKDFEWISQQIQKLESSLAARTLEFVVPRGSRNSITSPKDLREKLAQLQSLSLEEVNSIYSFFLQEWQKAKSELSNRSQPSWTTELETLSSFMKSRIERTKSSLSRNELTRKRISDIHKSHQGSVAVDLSYAGLKAQLNREQADFAFLESLLDRENQIVNGLQAKLSSFELIYTRIWKNLKKPGFLPDLLPMLSHAF